MGNRPPRRACKQEPVAFVPQGMDLLQGNDGKVYSLQQHRPGNTRSTFWRPDPRTKQLQSGVNFPRNGAVLRGTPIVHEGTKWLIVSHVAQNQGRGGWQYAPKGAALPFETSKYRLNEVDVHTGKVVPSQ